MERVVFMKQSGESLATGDNILDEEAIHDAAVRIKIAHASQEDLGVLGLTIVSGGGNIMRGGANASPMRDFVGRLATIANTLMLDEMLKNLDVPVTTYMAPGTVLHDKASAVTPQPYEPSHMIRAHQQGEVSLLANGMGINGQTTDAAVVQCAASYMNAYRTIGALEPVTATILKSTRYDGVYTVDPAQDATAERYRVIGAPQMLANYERFAAVDRPSLCALVDDHLSMTVFSGEHSVVDVLQEDFNGIAGKGIGTLILPQAIEPQIYRD